MLVFWNQYSVIIIAVGAFLFLALIGFIAEKTNLVSYNNKKAKEKDVTKKEDVVATTVVEPNSVKEVINVNGKKLAVDDIEEIDFGTEVIPTPVMEDIGVPDVDDHELADDSSVHEIVPTFEGLNIPQSDEDIVIPKQPIMDTIKINNGLPVEKKEESADIKMDPSVPQELFQPLEDSGNNTQNAEEDIWKF